MSVVTGTASIQAYLAKFRMVGPEIAATLDDEMNHILDDLVANAPDVTPWRKKPPSREQDPHMQGVYYKDVYGMTGLLMNERPYSELVARTGTSRMQPNARIKAWLEHYDDEAEVLLDAAVNARLAALGI